MVLVTTVRNLIVQIGDAVRIYPRRSVDIGILSARSLQGFHEMKRCTSVDRYGPPP